MQTSLTFVLKTMSLIITFTIFTCFAEKETQKITPPQIPVATAKEIPHTTTTEAPKIFDLKSFMEEKDFFTRSNFIYLTEENKIIVNAVVVSGTESGTESSSPTEKVPENEVAKKTEHKFQKLDGFVAGIHGKNCHAVSDVLTQYEKYKDFISFIKVSDYVDGKVILEIEAPIIGKRFKMDIKVDRLKGAGIYPYVMGTGLFTGLTGNIHFIDLPLKAGKTDTECLVYVDAHWKGADSGYFDVVIQEFVSVVSKEGLKGLFRISGHQPKD